MTGEDRIQKAVVEYLRIQYPNWITFSIPNGSNKSRAQAGIMKATGLLSGVPDLCILTPDKPIFIEIKSEGGRLSTAQKELHPRMDELGYPVYVCRSIDDVIDILVEVA